MATDRQKTAQVVIITRVTYSKPGPDLLQRTKLKIKDEDDVVHVISDTGWVNVGKRSDFKKELKDERNSLQNLLDTILGEYQSQIDFLNEQITDIEAL